MASNTVYAHQIQKGDIKFLQTPVQKNVPGTVPPQTYSEDSIALSMNGKISNKLLCSLKGDFNARIIKIANTSQNSQQQQGQTPQPADTNRDPFSYSIIIELKKEVPEEKAVLEFLDRVRMSVIERAASDPVTSNYGGNDQDSFEERIRTFSHPRNGIAPLHKQRVDKNSKKVIEGSIPSMFCKLRRYSLILAPNANYDPSDRNSRSTIELDWKNMTSMTLRIRDPTIEIPKVYIGGKNISIQCYLVKTTCIGVEQGIDITEEEEKVSEMLRAEGDQNREKYEKLAAFAVGAKPASTPSTSSESLLTANTMPQAPVNLAGADQFLTALNNSQTQAAVSSMPVGSSQMSSNQLQGSSQTSSTQLQSTLPTSGLPNTTLPTSGLPNTTLPTSGLPDTTSSVSIPQLGYGYAQQYPMQQTQPSAFINNVPGFAGQTSFMTN